MTKHTKPTQEELEANAQKALEEAEKMKEVEKPEEEPEEVIEETKSDTENPPPAVPSQEDIDYKKKFTESSREAQILHAKNKQINEAIEKAKSIPEPTEEELMKEYEDWDVLSDTERKLAKSSLMASRRFDYLDDVTKESKDIEAWNGKVDSFISDPKTLIDNPDLEGKEEDFKYFAGKPSRRGVDFPDLVSAFLYSNNKAKAPPQKGKMFETGSGGTNEKPKNDTGKITIDQARSLRNTNYAKYKEYLKAGKIENENI